MEEAEPGRAAAAWTAVSAGGAGAAHWTAQTLTRLMSLIGSAGGTMTEQTRRVPPAAWIAATAVIVIATLGVTGRITRLVMAPIGWVTGSTSGLFPAQAKNGVAEIQTVPDGAQVWLNGRQIGVTPLKTEFAAGSHEVELRYRGSSRTLTLEVPAGGTVVQQIEWAAPK